MGFFRSFALKPCASVGFRVQCLGLGLPMVPFSKRYRDSLS